VSVVRPLLFPARPRALPENAAECLTPVGETMFPPRTPFFQRPILSGNLPVPLRLEALPAKPATPGPQTGAPTAPLGPLPAHRQEACR
jgi:hypothetical protein